MCILYILVELCLVNYFTMKLISTSFHYLLLIIPLSKSEVNKEHYQRQFRLKSFGSLTSAYKVLFSGDGGSFPAALRECNEFCQGDRRCIGMEICQIREDLYRCRACCEWMKLGKKAELTKDMIACKYYEMVYLFLCFIIYHNSSR